MHKQIGQKQAGNENLLDGRMVFQPLFRLRCNFLPKCYMAPEGVRELRKILRVRNLMVKEATKMKTKTSGILMETGAMYNKQKLYRQKYFGNYSASGCSGDFPPLFTFNFCFPNAHCTQIAELAPRRSNSSNSNGRNLYPLGCSLGKTTKFHETLRKTT